MTTLTDTQVVTASGGLVELGYLERTSNLSLSTGISPATSELVIGSISAVCDGSPVEIEFFASDCTPASGSGNYLAFSLYVDGVEHTQVWGFFSNQAASLDYKPVFLKRRIVPSAGVHTFAVRAYSVAAGGFIEMRPGGADRAPGFLRVSKIVSATQWPAVTTGTIICTSTTRPASPFEGQEIYETDTKKQLTYDGTGWYAFRQLVGRDEKTSTQILTSSQTTFQDEGLSSSVTYGKNRILRLTLNVRPYPAGGLQGMGYRVLRGASDVVAYWSLEQATLQSGTAAPVTLVYMVQTPSSGSTETFKVQFKANTSNTSVQSYATATTFDGARQMMIEDIGPA